MQLLEKKIEKKRKRKRERNLKEPIQMAWRLPIMIVTVSSFVFICLTAAFGITVNKNTEEVNFGMDPGDDWMHPMTGKSFEDKDNINPMRQFPDWIFFAMILGYFIAVGILCYGWWGYMKYREKLRMELLLANKNKGGKKSD